MPLAVSTLDGLSDAVFTTLLHDVKAPHFLNQHLDRRAVILTGEPARFDGLFDGRTFCALAVDAGRLHASFVDVDGWMVNVAIAPGQIQRMLGAGMSVLAEKLPEQGRLEAFLDAYRSVQPSAQPLQLDGAVCPNRSLHPLGIHSTPICIFQVAGRYTWRYVPEPIPGGAPLDVTMPADVDSLPLPWGDLLRPPADAFVEQTLNPGDTFYLPAGCWHEGFSVGESTVLAATVKRRAPLDILRGLMANATADPASPRPPLQRVSPAEMAASVQRTVAGGWSAADLNATWQALLDEAGRPAAN
ncbi:hypothetical protein GCM10007242_39640 [Pigmentiphaga litoralis]|uniref:JmjC domain-containing protein n=1 Tax=Pigmentiphaga litoralis TaxID=516702 RepID=UPI001675E8B0|nr:cupin domain-containing protein [Pigmentiphaga litoralis]GGX29277.1 hypothetical protein GCM10007242_39640 [Pigmentiphaga litoralis]